MSLGEAHAMVAAWGELIGKLLFTLACSFVIFNAFGFLVVMAIVGPFFHPWLLWVYEIAGTLIIFSLVVWRIVR